MNIKFKAKVNWSKFSYRDLFKRIIKFKPSKITIGGAHFILKDIELAFLLELWRMKDESLLNLLEIYEIEFSDEERENLETIILSWSLEST